ncbi:cache domain-containing protein [Paenibacillus sp. P25]|nr:cache domain-containing protein [Paenibacillus sp. P25]
MLDASNWIAVFHKIGRKRFFIKLIMTTVLIAVLPNLLSNVVAYYKVARTFEQETGSSKLQYLNQTINAIEIVLNRIKENSNLLALNQPFQDFERFPNGGYYEGLQGELPREDLPALYGYLEAKKNAILTINSFKLSNEFVDSVYFYDSGKNLVLTSESGGTNRQFALDDFYDKDWLGALEDKKNNPVILDTRMSRPGHAAEKSLLSLVYKSNKNGNALIINLDASVIYRDLVSKLSDQDHIFAVSSDGGCHASSGSRLSPSIVVRHRARGAEDRRPNRFLRHRIKSKAKADHLCHLPAAALDVYQYLGYGSAFQRHGIH